MSDETPQRITARRGFSVSYKGKTLLSTMDPIGLAERTVDRTPKLNRTLYLCPSPLYGYGIPLLMERMSPDSAAVCVETDVALLDISREAMGDLLAKHDRLRLLDADTPAELCAAVREAWGGRSFRRVEILRLSGGWQLNPELYESLAMALQKDIAIDWGNAMTLVKLGRRYALNALRNLSLLPRSPPIASLSFGAAPALVLGAGPSLDPALSFLSERFGTLLEAGAGDRPFRIICVDTCLASLRERNIKPDLAVALESQHWNLRDFVGLGDWELPVAMDLSALPSGAEMLGAHPALFITPWTELSLFKRLYDAGLLPEIFPPMGSVGLTAAALARRLSSGPVIAAGIDFSFTLDQFHSRSSPGHQERLRRQTRLFSLINEEAAFRKGTFPALAKTGAAVRSDPVMKKYRDLFEQEFRADPRFYDIAGSGLPLGVNLLTLEEAASVLTPETGAAPPVESGRAASHYYTDSYTSRRAAVEAFIQEEIGRLKKLRSLLTGEAGADRADLEFLLEACGYLWSHFPDCAGAGGRRPSRTDLGFLKRVRTETDPFIRVLELSLRELEREGAHRIPVS
jgi:hypothetical protein